MRKKKLLQRLLVAFFMSVSAISICHGQAAIIVLILGDKVATEEFHLSIDGAINLSNYNGIEGGKLGGGVNFGLGTHIKLGEKWHLKPEFKPLSRKKVKSVNPITEVPDELLNTESLLNLNYIDIPVFLQYNISPKLFVSAGPEISFLTSASQLTQGNLENGFETSAKIDTESFFNNISFSFPVEVGYSLSLANKRSTSTLDINIFARYDYGFSEIFKDPAIGSTNISLFQIGLSMPFIKTPEEMAKSKD